MKSRKDAGGCWRNCRNEQENEQERYLRERLRASGEPGFHYLGDSRRGDLYVQERGTVYGERKTGRADTGLEEQEEKILNYAGGHGGITRKEAEELLDCGTTKAYHILQKLCEDGKLTARGNGRLRTYGCV